jgi:hypothetical protein
MTALLLLAYMTEYACCTMCTSLQVDALLRQHRAKHGITARAISDEEIVARCFLPLINEGFKVITAHSKLLHYGLYCMYRCDAVGIGHKDLLAMSRGLVLLELVLYSVCQGFALLHLCCSTVYQHCATSESSRLYKTARARIAGCLRVQ